MDFAAASYGIKSVELLGVAPEQYSAGQMSYDLRRLVRKGIICRVHGTQRRYLSPYGWKVARLYSRLEARVFRPALAAIHGAPAPLPAPLKQALAAVDTQLDQLIAHAFPHRKAA